MLFALAGALSPVPSIAQTPDAVVSARPKTCLVLGGGGARGAAHIGVLKVIERERIPIDCIVGTSMGAIVGGLYAAGYSADEIEAILAGIDWTQVLHDRPPRDERSMRRKEEDLRLLGGVELGIHDGKIAFPRGILQGQRLELLLRRLLLPVWQAEDFDALPIPFRAVATDIVSGEKVVFARGDLAVAIRASMSVPGAFAPIRVDGRLLVDGGVVDNVPIDEARKLGAQRLIVSRVGTPLVEEDKLTSPLAISHQVANILMIRNVEAQVATLTPDDVLMVPDMGDMGSEDFDRAVPAIAAGLAAAEQAAPRLQAFSVDEVEYGRFQQHHRLPVASDPVIRFVQVPDGRSRTSAFVEQRMQSQLDKPLQVDALEAEIATIYGEDRYEKLQWQMAEREGEVGLRVVPEDKSWGPDFLHFGLRLSDNFNGDSNYQLLAQYSKTGLDERGSELELGVAFGQVVELYGEYYRPFGHAARHGLLAGLNYRATDFPLYDIHGDSIAEFRYGLTQASLSWRYSPQRNWEWFLGASLGRERISQQVGLPDLFNTQQRDLASVSIGITHDSLDSAAFPGRGQRFSLRNDSYTRAAGGEDAANAVRVQWDGAWSHGADHVLGGIRFSSSEGGGQLLATYGFLGGLGNLSGYPEQAIFASQVGLARLIYYRRLTRDDALVSVPLYLGGSVEMGGYWESRDVVSTDSLIQAGSIFIGADTFLGPVFLGYGHADTGHNAFYLTFGSLLRGRDPF